MNPFFRMTVPAWLAMALAGCDPQALADQTTSNMAREVMVPVLARDMTLVQAEQAADCILPNAAMPEIRALARDYGVEAGTLTRENIRNLASRPAVQSCLAARGLPPVR